MGFSEITLLTVFFLILGYLRVNTWVWNASILIVMVIFVFFSSSYWILATLIWLPLAFPSFRQKWFSKPIMDFFNRSLPEMSNTEREALEAGDVWFEAELFQGDPDWTILHNYPTPTLTQEEQAFLDNEVETLCGMLDDFAITCGDQKNLPVAVWDYLKTKGFFGMIIEKKYGGRAFSALAHSAVIAKIGTRSPTTAITAMVPNSLGPAELLHAYGTEEQKTYYLPRLSRGEEIPCFALTGPDSGSDAATMQDYGIVCEREFQGKLTLGISLTFDKRYITLAPVATLIGLAFRLYDPHKKLGQNEEIGITLCLIPATHPGMVVGDRHYPMHLPFMNGPVRGKDVFIPLEWVIGGPAYVGEGWKMLMNCLSTGRSISLPAISYAASSLCYRMTGAYAMLRKQFNLSIAKFEGVEEKLARIAGLHYIITACRNMTAGAVDLKIKPSLVSAIAKYHTTEMVRIVINDAMDVHGGRAIQMGPNNYLHSAYLGIPIGITVEGANILTRNLIIFGQGLMRCHPYLLEEMRLSKAGDLKVFDRVLMKHVGYTVSNAIRSFVLGLTGARGVVVDAPKSVRLHYRRLTRMSAALAFVSDIAILVYGGNLKRKERISARLGDVLSFLYLSSSVLKRFRDCRESSDELPYVHWACQYCLYELQNALMDVIHNFSNRFLGGILRVLVFPFGKTAKKPNDRLDHQIVIPMLSPTALRDTLTKDCYVGDHMKDATGKVDITFEKYIKMEGLDKKFSYAVKSGAISRSCSMDEQLSQAALKAILTTEEAALYRDFCRMRNEVIAVDEFDAKLVYKEKML